MKITIIEKIIITFLILLSLFGAIMIQETALFEYPSQSFAADKDNVIWYILMHIGMIMTFFFLGAMFHKKFMYSITAFVNIGILAFDMFLFKIPHSIFTLLLYLLCSYCIIFYTKYADINKIFKYILASICFLVGIPFLLAVINPNIFLTVYNAELLIESIFGGIIIGNVWLEKFRYGQKELTMVG